MTSLKECGCIPAAILLLSLTASYGGTAGGAPGYLFSAGNSARAGSLGNACVADTTEPGIVLDNPAAMAARTYHELNLFHQRLLEGTAHSGFSFVRACRSRWTVGCTATQVQSPRIECTSSEGVPIADGAAADTTVLGAVAAAYRVSSRWFVGLDVRAQHKEFGTFQRTWHGWNVSCLWQPPVHGLTVATVVTNIAQTESERAPGIPYAHPVKTRTGVRQLLFNGTLGLAAEWEHTVGDEDHFRSGVEYRPFSNMFLRAGVDGAVWMFGFGVRFPRYGLDVGYALDPFGAFNPRLGFSYRFGNPLITGDLVPPAITVRTMDEFPLSALPLLARRNFPAVRVMIHNPSDHVRTFAVSALLGTVGEPVSRPCTVPANAAASVALTPGYRTSGFAALPAVVRSLPLTVSVAERLHGEERTVYTQRLSVSAYPEGRFVSSIVDADGTTHSLLESLVMWVAYNDPVLRDVVNRANDRGSVHVPPVKMIGPQDPHRFGISPTEDYDTAQVRLLYETLVHDYRIQYINQPVVFQETQRVQYPRETLAARGNCIDLAVLMAALLESLQFEPVILLLLEEGHAAVGWRSGNTLRVLDTNYFGEPFPTVLAKGFELFANLSPQDVVLDIAALRNDAPAP